MSREKGTPKTGGREAGSPNKVTSEIRTILSDEVGKQLEALPQLFEQLEPKERADLLTKLLKYILPPFDGISIKQDDRDEKRPIFSITVEDKETADSINRLADRMANESE